MMKVILATLIVLIIIMLFLKKLCPEYWSKIPSVCGRYVDNFIDRFNNNDSDLPESESYGSDIEPSKDAVFSDVLPDNGCNHYFTSVAKKDKGMFQVQNPSKIVNFGISVGGTLKGDEYDAIVMSEIGKDAIESQKKYCSYLINDSNVKYIDNSIETDRSDYNGLSLSRKSNPNVATTYSSQQPGLEGQEYQAVGAIGEFFQKNPVT